jgi:hypothetical protein
MAEAPRAKIVRTPRVPDYRVFAIVPAYFSSGGDQTSFERRRNVEFIAAHPVS